MSRHKALRQILELEQTSADAEEENAEASDEEQERSGGSVNPFALVRAAGVLCASA